MGHTSKPTSWGRRRIGAGSGGRVVVILACGALGALGTEAISRTTTVVFTSTATLGGPAPPAAADGEPSEDRERLAAPLEDSAPGITALRSVLLGALAEQGVGRLVDSANGLPPSWIDWTPVALPPGASGRVDLTFDPSSTLAQLTLEDMGSGAIETRTASAPPDEAIDLGPLVIALRPPARSDRATVLIRTAGQATAFLERALELRPGPTRSTVDVSVTTADEAASSLILISALTPIQRSGRGPPAHGLSAEQGEPAPGDAPNDADSAMVLYRRIADRDSPGTELMAVRSALATLPPEHQQPVAIALLTEVLGLESAGSDGRDSTGGPESRMARTDPAAARALRDRLASAAAAQVEALRRPRSVLVGADVFQPADPRWEVVAPVGSVEHPGPASTLVLALGTLLGLGTGVTAISGWRPMGSRAMPAAGWARALGSPMLSEADLQGPLDGVTLFAGTDGGPPPSRGFSAGGGGRAILVCTGPVGNGGKVGNHTGAEPAPGLREILRGEARISSVIGRSSTDDFDVILPGPSAGPEAELLRGPGLRGLCLRLSEEYARVAVHVPSVGSSAALETLLTIADRVVLVVPSKRHAVGDALEAARRIRAAGAELRGFMLREAD